MSKNATSKKTLKKEARRRVYDKLVAALAEFKTGRNDKKFEKNLRRTSKLFAVDLLRSQDKAATPKIVKKKTDNKKEEESVQRTA